MKLKWLDNYLALIETGSFSAAAAHRHVSQPAFSRRIQLLEHWLGVTLVDRAGKPLQLTPVAAESQAAFRSLVARICEFRATLKSESLDIADLTIAMQHSLAASYLPAFLKRLNQLEYAPNFRIGSETRSDAVTMPIRDQGAAWLPTSPSADDLKRGKLMPLKSLGRSVAMSIVAYFAVHSGNKGELLNRQFQALGGTADLLPAADERSFKSATRPRQSTKARHTWCASPLRNHDNVFLTRIACQLAVVAPTPKEGTPMTLTLKILGALLVTGVVTSALAQGTLEKIKTSGAISVGHRDASIPFAYLDDKQQPVGYSMDLCAKIVDAVKAELKMPNLKMALQPVTSATRIPLLANGTIDMECGSTTNNAERQKQIAYTMTSFVTANRFISKKADNLTKLADLKGKTVVSTSGSTNIKQITELNASQNLNLNILAAKDHAEAFLMVDTGRAAAFVMDDILLAGLAANHVNPGQWQMSAEALSVEPYGIMIRKDDPAFKKVVDGAMVTLMKSGEINKIYAKWFESKIPPKGINLNIPMSAALKRVMANPTDSPDPAIYK